MPRVARKKSDEAFYHVMSRSISEIALFESDDDKNYYLSLLKKYKDKYHCSIYAYCVMGNHVHLYINPKGFDISKFMHCLNTAYVAYYNKRYGRHGHLFQGRFLSKIVSNDTYNLTLSAYIHNNTKDIPEYAGREEQYRYSSYGIYTGYRWGTEEIVDTSFILERFSKNPEKAALKYRGFVEIMKETGIITEIDEEIKNKYLLNEYRSEKNHISRDLEPDRVVEKVCKILKEKNTESIKIKNKTDYIKIRAMVVFILNVLSGYTYKKICEFFGNLTLSGAGRLSNKGFLLYKSDKQCQLIFNSLTG